MKGTLLNVATVIAGGMTGTLAGGALPTDVRSFVLSLLGLVTIAMGVGMFLRSHNPVIVTAALALGGAIGFALGLQPLLDHAGESLRASVHGGTHFTEGFVAATVLFCVGPMTVLGCLEDGLTGRSPLLALKATLDFFAGLFLAAGLGIGVVFSAISVLVIQGAITLAARQLKFLQRDEAMLAEISGVGGPIVLGIGLGLLDVKHLPLANTLPALVLGPMFAAIWRRTAERKLEPDRS